jgi:hypothetical protein
MQKGENVLITAYIISIVWIYRNCLKRRVAYPFVSNIAYGTLRQDHILPRNAGDYDSSAFASLPVDLTLMIG